MKKTLIVILLILLLLPLNVFASSIKDGYKSMNLRETLKDEEITEAFAAYKETKKQVKIYMFRGAGCPHCSEFLDFLNDLAKTEGKKFKLISYEIWFEKDNKDLMDEVADKMGFETSGVPLIIIGKKVYHGFDSSDIDSIKKQINKMYKQKVSERYDVFDDIDGKYDNTVSEGKIIFYNFLFTAISTCIIIFYVNKKTAKRK